MIWSWSQLAEPVVDWLYPRVCPVATCGALSDRPGRYLCWNCYSKVDLVHAEDGLCEQCGFRVTGKVNHRFICSACRAMRPSFDRARAASSFSGPLREVIHQFKYQRAVWLKHDLVDFLQGCLQTYFAVEEIDVVVPVPLHPVRVRERSYNQSALLATELARRIDRRCDLHALIRTRQTETQTHLNAVSRHHNMRGAFQVVVPEWVTRRCVLLVDDVMTTGATVSACAQVLKKAGARTVWVVTVARG